MKKVELLSPVGNVEMLYQAIHNGADAVYLSGKFYGARKFSNNFTNVELIEAIKYSHLYGVKVYVTVNTMIYENEVNNFIEYVEFLYKNNVDALIMQDLGMINLVKQKFPDIDIHASTQCHNHNQEGIELLKNLGCSRVVMAREMSLNEIRTIDVPIEKEIFVYGALCVCYSGCCLFSSLNGGRSGNRGECVGSCRLPYKLVKNNDYIDLKDKYLISTKELNTLSNLKELLDSNIDSLKIEGRMKSPYYVGYVTRVYRNLIDNYYNNRKLIVSDREFYNLKKLFNREFTKGYLFNDNDIVNAKSPNHLGVVIGKVIKFDNRKIYIKLLDNISQEDGIRFRNSNVGMIINKLYNEKGLLTNEVLKGNVCVLDNKLGINKLDIVLKTIDSKLIKELENYSFKRIKVDFEAKFRIGSKFEISITDGNNKIIECGDVVEKAIKREVIEDDIKKCINKLGNTPFECNKINILKDDNIFIGLKSINDVRRQLIEKLIYLRSNYEYKRKVLNIRDANYVKSDDRYYLNVLVRNEEQLKCCLDNGVDNIYIVDYELYNKYSYLDNIYYRCSRVNSHYIDISNSKLLVGELGSISAYGKDNILVGDYYLNVANSHSIELLNKLGLKRVTLSVELDDDKIENIMKKNYNVELIVYGRLELMIMKYCPLKKCLKYCDKCKSSNDLFYLEDKFFNRYPIVRDNCLTHIMHYKNINNIEKIGKYKEMGIKNYRLELFDENYDDIEKYIRHVRRLF